jgi:peptide/nickel transport system permease protein
VSSGTFTTDVTQVAGEPGSEHKNVHTTVRSLLRRRLRESWLFRIGVAIVSIDLFLMLFGPMLAPLSLTSPTGPLNAAPSGAHPFGTDSNGLDVLSRVIAAPRVDISIALCATAIGVILGTFVGLGAGFSRRRAGDVIMRVVDATLAFPGLIFLTIVVYLAGRSVLNIVMILGLLTVPLYVRLAYAEVLSLRERPFVEAAVANGDRPMSIALRHVLPNALTPALAYSGITMAQILLGVAGLSFIGAGIRPPTADWGGMISAGAGGIQLGQWWMSLYPGAAITVSVFGFAATTEGVQRALGRR